jgi:LacI family transcriptional regulator
VLVFAGSCDEDPRRERELISSFRDRRVDGIIVVPASHDHTYLYDEQRAGTALVFVDRPPRFMPGDAVVSDNAGGAQLATQHLIAHGHRRIGFLGDRLSVFTAGERLAGYHRALADAGLDRSDELERAGLADSASAGRATRELLELAEPPTALFAGQNLVTIGAIRALRTAGRQREIALVGFDDVVLGDLVDPGVTVIAQDPYTLGRHAGDLLFSRLNGLHAEPSRVVVPTRLVARGSGEIPPA